MAILVIGSRGAGQVSFGVQPFITRIEVHGHLDTRCEKGQDPLLNATIDCWSGGIRRTGGDCLTCGHLVSWRADANGELTVDCSFRHSDLVTVCMTPAGRAVTILADQPASEAAALLDERKVKHLIVSDGRSLVGILARSDLVHPLPEGTRVADRMSREVFAIEPAATLGEAAAAMAALGIGCLPVVTERVVAGLITRGDLYRVGVSPSLFGR